MRNGEALEGIYRGNGFYQSLMVVKTFENVFYVVLTTDQKH
jgi:hypothetical protein